VYKTYNIDCLVKELDINNNKGNPTYKPTSLSKEEILSNYKSVISSFGLSIRDDYVNIPFLPKCLVTNSFWAKSGKRRYSYIVIHGLNAYFVKDYTNSTTKYTEDDIFNMINFLIDNIFINLEVGSSNKL